MEEVESGFDYAHPLTLGHIIMAELLTEKGSVSLEPTRGYDFLNRVRASTSELDINVAFNRAKLAILKKQLCPAGFPPDAKLKDLSIDRIRIVDDTILLSVLVTNRAGDTIAVDMPAIRLGKR